MRIALWYGGLLALALVIFGALLVTLTTNAIGESVRASLRAEARVATLDLRRALSPAAPYWPDQLSLEAVDTYDNPGVAVLVVDRQGHVRYRSTGGAADALPISSAAMQWALAGSAAWYDAQVEGEAARVEVVPVRPPSASGSGVMEGVDSDGAPRGSEPVIGALLVVKSLRDVDETLALLRTALVVTGALTLAAALVSGWAIAARVLQPLSDIALTARTVAANATRGARMSGLTLRARRPRRQDELTQLVDTFNEMLAALERATLTQRRFVADASHELRAPLTTVRGNLAFLRQRFDDLPPDERRTMLADAHAETLRLARLVDDLLLLARMEAKSDPAHPPRQERLSEPAGSNEVRGRKAADEDPEPARPAVVELDRVVLHLIRQLRGRLAVEHPALALGVGRIEPVRVRVDEEALRRVALILLDNAIKFSAAQKAPAGAERATHITVSVTRQTNYAVLEVCDTGMGIEAEDLPFIFDRFYRTDRARGRSGSGLGLAIARALVEQMDGVISAESVPGEGSVFTVRLPLADK
jgi:signal transduction histidine kinase